MQQMKHLDESTLDLQDHKWAPSIPLPLYTHRRFLLRAYECHCGQKFDTEDKYKLHYRREQLIELNTVQNVKYRLSQAKLLFWRRTAFIYRYGTADEVKEFIAFVDKNNQWPELQPAERIEAACQEQMRFWQPIFYRETKSTSMAEAIDAGKAEDAGPAGTRLGTSTDAYSHMNSKGVKYYLHRTDVQLRGGKMQKIYFFRKEIEQNNPKYEPCQLPSDMYVNENPRNGFLTVARKAAHGLSCEDD